VTFRRDRSGDSGRVRILITGSLHLLSRAEFIFPRLQFSSTFRAYALLGRATR